MCSVSNVSCTNHTGDCVAGLLLYDALCQDSSDDPLNHGQYHHQVPCTPSPTSTTQHHHYLLRTTRTSLRSPSRHSHRQSSVSPTLETSSGVSHCHCTLSKSLSMNLSPCSSVGCQPSQQLNLPQQQQTQDSPAGGLPAGLPPPSPTILVSSDSVHKEDDPRLCSCSFCTSSTGVSCSKGGGSAFCSSSQDLQPPGAHQVFRKVSAPLPVIPSISCSSMPRKSSAPCNVFQSTPSSSTPSQHQHHTTNLHQPQHLPLSVSPPTRQHQQQFSPISISSRAPIGAVGE